MRIFLFNSYYLFNFFVHLNDNLSSLRISLEIKVLIKMTPYIVCNCRNALVIRWGTYTISLLRCLLLSHKNFFRRIKLKIGKNVEYQSHIIGHVMKGMRSSTRRIPLGWKARLSFNPTGCEPAATACGHFLSSQLWPPLTHITFPHNLTSKPHFSLCPHLQSHPWWLTALQRPSIVYYLLLATKVPIYLLSWRGIISRKKWQHC